MNIQDWQKSKEEPKRNHSGAVHSDSAKALPTVPARLDVLEAELAAAASRPPREEIEDQKSKSCEPSNSQS